MLRYSEPPPWAGVRELHHSDRNPLHAPREIIAGLWAAHVINHVGFWRLMKSGEWTLHRS